MKMEIFPKNQQQMLVCGNRYEGIHDTLHAKWYWDLSNTGWGMDEQQYSGEPRKKPFLDMRLPLTWLLSALVAVGAGLVTVGMQLNTISTQMTSLNKSNEELKQQFKEQSEKYQTLRDSQFTMQYTMQRTVDSLVIQVAEIQRTLGRKP